MNGYIVFFLLLLLIPYFFRKRKIQAIAYFFVIALFAGIRYGFSYDYFIYVSFINGGYNHTETIPALLEILARFFNSPPVFFLLTSCFVTAFIIKSLYKVSSNLSLSVFLYVGLPTFLFQDLSTVRQAMATSIVFYLIVCISQKQYIRRNSNKQLLKILFWIFVAFLCHKAAIVALLLLLPWEKLNKRIGIILIAIAFLMGNMIVPIVNVLAHIIGGGVMGKLSSYVAEPMEGFFFVRIGMYIIVVALFAKYKALVQMHNRNKFYLNLICLSMIINGLFIVNSHLALRLSVFFWGPVLILLPDFIQLMKINHLICKVGCVCLFAVSIMTAYLQTILAEPSYYFYPYTTVFDKEAQF